MAVYRFLEYRRALWWAEGDLNLEALTRDAFAHLPFNTQRILEKADGSSVMGMRMRDCGHNGVIVHCAGYVDDQATGVIPMQQQADTTVTSRRPGNAENFLNRDFMGLISGNHVISLNAGVKAASLSNFLRGLFRQAELAETSGQFDLVRVSNVNKLAKISSSGGVASIQLDLAIDQAVQNVLEESAATQALPWGVGKVRSYLSEFIGDLTRDYEPAEGLANSQRGNLRLQISVPSGDVIPAKNGIEGAAIMIAEDDEATDYTINLRNGDTIKPGEISLKKRVRLDRFANSVDALQAQEELVQYLQELDESGHLNDE